MGGSTKGLNGGKEESTQDIEVTESRDVGKTTLRLANIKGKARRRNKKKHENSTT